jgi:single-strand selective monofunctional uracil DNA glycosylase
MTLMTPADITDALIADLAGLHFGAPVTHVYNPLVYAREPYDLYWQRYGQGPKEVVFVGMNPGPWGMVQTGIPFGEVGMVREWLQIEAPVEQPAPMHPRRPVTGFDCPRSEVSGKRLWGWAREAFGSPGNFFGRMFVTNYCPLAFMEAGGRNRTPNQLPIAERRPLLAACDRALARSIQWLRPRLVVGIGNFAAERARSALEELDLPVGRVSHPSPANPRANRGWQALVARELVEMGVAFEG